MSVINNIAKYNLKHIHSHQVLTNEGFINHSKIIHYVIYIFIHWRIQNTTLKYAYTVLLLIHLDLPSSLILFSWFAGMRGNSEHLPKIKHEKHFELWAEAQYMHSWIVKWSLNTGWARFAIHFKFKIVNEINVKLHCELLSDSEPLDTVTIYE